MQKIRELIVVEGKHDRQKLEKLFDCDVICTDGLSMSTDVLETIRTIGKQRGVIILTDPDHPGEVIRKKIAELVPDRQHVFVSKKEAIGKRNVGIEYVSDEDLIRALENRITFDNKTESLRWSQFLDLGLVGNSEKRRRLCEKLHIAFSNNKTLYKRLNLMGMTYGDLRKLI